MEYVEYLQNRLPYQAAGVPFLLERKHACLYYKPGKGKTYPCIEATRDIDKSMNGNARVLVMSTAGAIRDMWNVEIVPQKIMPKNTMYVTFSAAIQEKRKVELIKQRWDVIIIDECHRIKAHNSQISKLCFTICKKARFVFGLSGTPVGNTELDVFCQFHNMHISWFGDISYSRFVDECCDVDKKFMGGRMFTEVLGINHRYRAGFEANVAKYSQRIDYEDDGSMPELSVETVKLPFVKTKEYKDTEEGIIKLADYETTMAKLNAVNKMHQAANGYLYIPKDGGGNHVVEFKHNDKLDWIKNNVRDDEKVVIVYRFVKDLEDLRKAFPKSVNNVEDFKAGKSNKLLLQCSQCESFNLQMCNRMIFYTLDYSFISYDQMCKRIYRMGQKLPVKIQTLIFDGSIENKIWSAVRRKESLSNLFMSIKGDL